MTEGQKNQIVAVFMINTISCGQAENKQKQCEKIAQISKIGY